MLCNTRTWHEWKMVEKISITTIYTEKIVCALCVCVCLNSIDKCDKLFKRIVECLIAKLIEFYKIPLYDGNISREIHWLIVKLIDVLWLIFHREFGIMFSTKTTEISLINNQISEETNTTKLVANGCAVIKSTSLLKKVIDSFRIYL